MHKPWYCIVPLNFLVLNIVCLAFAIIPAIFDFFIDT